MQEKHITSTTLTPYEKKEAIDRIFNDLAKSAFNGVLVGSISMLFFGSKSFALLIFGYSMGNSFRKSNKYLMMKYKTRL